jgi:methionine-rich copper-binding protein CopC
MMRARPVVTPARLAASLLAALVMLLPALGASPAQAHDVLVSTSPADGATVATTPDEIVLTFNQPALAVGTQMVVSGPDGQVQQGPPRLLDSTVRQSLAPGSPAGRYTVTWRVTSADGHPVSGTFSFSATAPGSGPSGATAPSTTTGATTSTTAAPPSATSDASERATTPTATAVPSDRTTGGADRTGTSWAVFAAIGFVLLAGLVALLARLRGGHADRGHG